MGWGGVREGCDLFTGEQADEQTGQSGQTDGFERLLTNGVFNFLLVRAELEGGVVSHGLTAIACGGGGTRGGGAHFVEGAGGGCFDVGHV